MIIHNKNIGFKLTTGASAEIANLCPDRDISKVGDLLSGAYADSIINCEKFARILNKWYVRCEKFEGREADLLEEGECLTLDPSTYQELIQEAMNSFANDSKTEVKSKPVKKTQKGE